MRLKSAKIALCGVLAGLSVVIMLSTYLLPSLTYALPMIAGGILIIPCIEFGSRTGFTMYLAVALLSVFIAAEKEAAMFYALLFGIYPIIKKYFERIPARLPEYAVKLVYFNAAAVGAVYISAKLLGLDLADELLPGKFGAVLLLLLGNVVFLIYDLALTRCIYIYVNRVQDRLRKRFGLEK